MPKTYPTHEQRQEPESDPMSRKTVGVYDRRRKHAKEIMIVIALLVVLAVVFVLYRLAKGAQYDSTESSSGTIAYAISPGDERESLLVSHR